MGCGCGKRSADAQTSAQLGQPTAEQLQQQADADARRNDVHRVDSGAVSSQR